uniref:Uncharacterized protein n=1 Tax=Branchiostoma floridae TaxID=7739 RepID=C3ZVU5_BRAFL|eukprot:XP_002587349.1 hypothetical protein BRAFLDRAFT_100546 [Branchiostoma floridae]
MAKWHLPSSTPGIFTLFCPNGVCYGFEAMHSCESVHHPFEIFRTRLTTAPRIVVYDNSCQLHRYAMIRDPYFFRNNVFFVNRVHSLDMLGASLGYCIDSLSVALDVGSISNYHNFNSQDHLRPIRTENSTAFRIPPSRTDYHRYSFYMKTARDWNALLEHIAQAKNLEAFKNALRTSKLYGYSPPHNNTAVKDRRPRPLKSHKPPAFRKMTPSPQCQRPQRNEVGA